MKKLLIFLGIFVLLVAGCLPSRQQIDEIVSAAEQTAIAQITFVPVTTTPNINTMVAQTLEAMSAQPTSGMPVATEAVTYTPTVGMTITPTVEPGSISGRLSYPSDFIPPLRVVAFQVNGFNYRYVDTMQNQSNYHITGLLPGIYHVVAYIVDGTLAGGYTKAVACGLSIGCTDHSLVNVTVEAGKDVPGIDPGDWYAPEGSFPPMP